MSSVGCVDGAGGMDERAAIGLAERVAQVVAAPVQLRHLLSVDDDSVIIVAAEGVVPEVAEYQVVRVQSVGMRTENDRVYDVYRLAVTDRS